MKNAPLGVVIVGLLALAIGNSHADTAWSSISSSDWGTPGNWTNGTPALGPQLAIYRGTATLQKSVTLGAVARETVGMRFTLTAAGTGYTFTGLGVNPGFFVLSGGSVNGIINSDDSTATFNVPIKLLDGAGLAGSGAAMTWNAAAGNMVFNGSPSAASPWTLNLNGASALTIDGSFNVSVGTLGSGLIVNTNLGTSTGFIKNGTGSLFLGGSAANTFTGTNFLNAGKITAGKANALGLGNALVMSGGTFEANGFSQTNGILDLNGSAKIDFGTGTVGLSFDNSSGVDWGGFSLNITNWTAGVDTLRFGTDSTGLTQDQLNNIHFIDTPFEFAGIDGFGVVTPVPEPNAAWISIVGLLVIYCGRRMVVRSS